MNLESQKQDSRTVQTVGNRRALDQIIAARDRFKESHGVFPTLIQVGSELFKRAFPLAEYPHRVGAVGETVIFPRPDICGQWAIVCMKPPELRRATESAA